jgi:hypothetical protein
MPSIVKFTHTTPLCSSSRSPKLVPEVDYYYGAPDDKEGIRRPLSPVRIRRELKGETPPKLLTVKEKNEDRARDSPFVSHMPKSKKEHYLFVLGSVRQPDDPDLLKEIALSTQLSKISTPIKTKQNSRSLHQPKKVGGGVTGVVMGPGTVPGIGPGSLSLYTDEYSGKQTVINVSPIKTRVPLPRIDLPENATHESTLQSHKATTTSVPPVKSGSQKSQSHGNIPRGPKKGLQLQVLQEPGYNVDGDDMLWNNLNYSGGPLVPSFHAPSAHTLSANACATPGSAISDLSDRDTMTPLYTDRDSMGTRHSGGGGGGASGIYGDFEDDLISAGSVNDNDDEYIL